MSDGCSPETCLFLKLISDAVPELAPLTQKWMRDLDFSFNMQETRIFFQADSCNKTVVVGMDGFIRLCVYCIAFAKVICRMSNCSNKLDDAKCEEIQKYSEESLTLLTNVVIHEITATPEWRQKFSQSPNVKDLFLMSSEYVKHIDQKEVMVASELFQDALVFILLHELAHLELKHMPLVSADQEKEADRMAGKWFLENATDQEKDVRCIGIAVVLSWVAIRDIYWEEGDVTQRASGYDRLYCLLAEWLDEGGESEEVWKGVAILLYHHCCIARAKLFELVWVSSAWMDRVNRLMDYLSSPNGLNDLDELKC